MFGKEGSMGFWGTADSSAGVFTSSVIYTFILYSHGLILL